MKKSQITAIIVEDEKLARELVKNYLQDYDDIKITAECADGFAGIKAINTLKPDLVFLDIQMPKLTGFEMLEILEFTPNIIFTTAYDQFAIKAFENNAIDYLLKPFSKERFREAVEKAILRINNNTSNSEQVVSLSNTAPVDNLKRIVVKSGSKIKIIPVERIRYIESQDDYTMIYTEESKHLKQKTMKYFESCLDPGQFIRIHRSYIVNVEHIIQLEPYEKDSYLAILKDNTKLKVSQSGMKNLKDKLNF